MIADIYIYDQIEDIDANFIKEKIDVNYNYNDEFSPKHILEKIELLY